MASINVINRTLILNNPESEIGKFLQQFWNKSLSYPEQGSDSNFKISVTNISDAQKYWSHPSQKFLQSFEIVEHNVDIHTLNLSVQQLDTNQEEVSWIIGSQLAGAYLSFENESANIEYWGGSSILAFIILAAIMEALRYSGLLCLHAAAASCNGHGYVFLGKSGTGKTTTLLRTIKSGWSPLAEDTILVDPTTMLAYGWEKAIRLLPNSLQVLDESLRSQSWDMHFDKYAVPYDRLCEHYGTVRQFSFPVNHIVQLSRQDNNHDKTCQWSEISSIELTKSLWNTVGLPLAKRSQQLTAQDIGKIASQCSAWNLDLGNINLPLTPPKSV